MYFNKIYKQQKGALNENFHNVYIYDYQINNDAKSVAAILVISIHTYMYMLYVQKPLRAEVFCKGILE